MRSYTAAGIVLTGVLMAASSLFIPERSPPAEHWYQGDPPVGRSTLDHRSPARLGERSGHPTVDDSSSGRGNPQAEMEQLDQVESVDRLLELLPPSCLPSSFTAIADIDQRFPPDSVGDDRPAADRPEDEARFAALFESPPSGRSTLTRLPPVVAAPRESPGDTGHRPFSPHADASHRVPGGNRPSAPMSNSADPHAAVFAETEFPSALECASCHQQIYDEWSISSHAYASISPMFHRFEQKINELAQGTVGYFCMRCHAPVATTMGLRRDQPIWDGPRVFREGVTCVACHRVSEQYAKTNGERRIEPGPLTDPIYGSGDGSGLREVLSRPDFYSVKDDPQQEGPGQLIHLTSIPFEQLSRSDFCASCHQVAIDPGIKLEVVWDQYRASPAYQEGITCQDCHMGRNPGVADGYDIGPAAVINDRAVNPGRRHSNHVFFGPGSAIAHPGLFPHHKDADRWTVNEWLMFDWRAGWGTEEFEERLAEGAIQSQFPPAWDNIDDRYDAREIIADNLRSLHRKRELRTRVMENGSHVDGPWLETQPRRHQDLVVRYQVHNLNRGHNLPSGSLGAQPQVWLNVVLIGPDGTRRWESGHLDSQGDLADIHSLDVLQGRLPLDRQLFNLQTRFLTTNVKGTDREMFLPINVDVDQLPFIRPGTQPISVMNHPPFIRMEARSLPPLGARDARFRIPGEAFREAGPYRLSARLRSRSEPIYFMRYVGATEEMKRAMIESTIDLHQQSVVVHVH